MRALVMVLVFALVGCSSQSKKAGGTAAPNESIASHSLKLGGSSDQGGAGALHTIHFEYGTAHLVEGERAHLRENAEYLKRNATLMVSLEGHCDERGSQQFNLALGQQRALVVKDFLRAQGIKSKRLQTLSLGSEQPLEHGHDESAWAKNRRVNFAISAL